MPIFDWYLVVIAKKMGPIRLVFFCLKTPTDNNNMMQGAGTSIRDFTGMQAE